MQRFCRDSSTFEVRYTAPERIGQQPPPNPVNELGKCDVWSLGCILFEICYARPRFRDIHDVRHFAESNHHDPDINFTNNEVADVLRKWIISMLTVDCSLRPNVQQLGQRFNELITIITPFRAEIPLDCEMKYINPKFSISTDIPPDPVTRGTFESLHRENLFPVQVPKYRKRRLRRAKQILAARTELLGAQHLLTVWSMTVLAWIYYMEGPFGDAVTLFQDLVDVSSRINGPEHRDTLAVNAGLAWTLAQKMPDEARQVFHAVRTLQEEVLGPKHPDTLNTISGLGKEILMDAYTMFEEAAKIEEHLTETTPSSKSIEPQKRAMVEKRKQGKKLLQQALELLEQISRDQSAIIGNKHRDTAETLSYIAWAYSLKGNKKHSAQVQSQIFAIQKEVLGMSSQETLFTLSEWGWRLIEIGQPEGIKKLEEAFERQKLVLAKSHKQTRSSRDGLIWAYSCFGQESKAEKLKHIK